MDITRDYLTAAAKIVQPFNHKLAFYNACRILMNLDMDELVRAGVLRAGIFGGAGSEWHRFNSDPLTFLAKLDDPTADKLWTLIQARQPERYRA